MDRLVILLAAIFASAIATETHFNCTPGETFQVDCNTCRCSADGRAAGCTLMACPTITPSSPPPTASKEPEAHFNCTPGETFKIDCNTCKCGSDGRTAACTRRACPTPSPAPVPSEEQESQFNCTPGEMFMKDCNTCVCSPDGKSAGCTEIGCPSSPSLSQEPATDFSCSPGKTYKVDCNTCICSTNGKTASCTAMACPPASLVSSQESHSSTPASESDP